MTAGLDDVNASKQRLSGIYGDLNARLAPMAEFWRGGGNESYAAVQQRWNQAMESMMDVLNRIATALNGAIEIHSTAEQRITSSWQA